MAIGNILSGVAGGAVVSIIIRATDQYSKEIKNADTTITKFAKSAKIAAAAAAAAFAAFAVSSMKQAADFESQLLKLEVVTQGNTKSFQRMKRIISDEAGGLFSEQDVARSLAYAKSVGVADDTIEQLIPRLKDTASLFGEDLSLAITAVTRAMKFGEAELAERIGLTLRENAVLHISEKLYGKRLSQLNEEEKERVILNAIIEQTEKFLGGEERALETAAGQYKELQVILQDIQKEFGTALLPTVKEFLTIIVENKDELIKLAEALVAILGAVMKIAGATVKGVSIGRSIGKFKESVVLGTPEEQASAARGIVESIAPTRPDPLEVFRKRAQEGLSAERKGTVLTPERKRTVEDLSLAIMDANTEMENQIEVNKDARIAIDTLSARMIKLKTENIDSADAAIQNAISQELLKEQLKEVPSHIVAAAKAVAEFKTGLSSLAQVAGISAQRTTGFGGGFVPGTVSEQLAGIAEREASQAATLEAMHERFSTSAPFGTSSAGNPSVGVGQLGGYYGDAFISKDGVAYHLSDQDNIIAFKDRNPMMGGITINIMGDVTGEEIIKKVSEGITNNLRSMI